MEKQSSRTRRWKGSADEHGGCNDCRPQTLLVADGSLRDVLRTDDLIRQLVYLFLFVPALVRIEFQSERRREHFGGKFLGIVAGDVFALAEAVMLRQIAVEIPIAWDGNADRGGNE